MLYFVTLFFNLVLVLLIPLIVGFERSGVFFAYLLAYTLVELLIKLLIKKERPVIFGSAFWSSYFFNTIWNYLLFVAVSTVMGLSTTIYGNLIYSVLTLVVMSFVEFKFDRKLLKDGSI